MKLLFIWIVAGFLFFSASADEEHHRFAMDLHDLHLNPQQHQALKEAMREYRDAAQTLHHEQKRTQAGLDTLFLAPKFDKTAFEAAYLERVRASVRIRSRLFEQLHAILTPEQKHRFVKHIEEWELE